MRSLLELSGEARLHLTLGHSVVGFLGGLGESHLLVCLTVQFSWTIPSFDEEGRPSMAGPGLSATYQLVWRHFEHCWPLGVHSLVVSSSPNCGIFDPLYAISLVLQGQSPVGLPSVVICLGNNLGKMWRGITLPLAPVSTLHLGLPQWFGPISAGMVTVAQASVSASMLVAVMLMCSGSLGAGEGMLIGGTIVAEWAFWATPCDNVLGLAWSSKGSWPSQA